MDKKLIKEYLDATFLLSEETKATGLKKTEDIQKDSAKSNKEYYKEVEKKMADYDKVAKTDEKVNSEATKKYENNSDQKEYHDEVEILNGQEMIDYDNEPTEDFKERAKEAAGVDGGSSRMGNKSGEGTANAEATFDASSDEFGDDLQKRVKSRKKKADAEAKATFSMGDDVEFDNSKAAKKKDLALAENTKPKKMKKKRAVFTEAFNGVENALKLIPESYKVDNYEFEMTDGNENYEMKWVGDINEGKAIITKASDKNLMSESMDKMKHLMGYKSEDTLGTLKGEERITENKSFNDVWDKTKSLLSEGDKDKTEE
jgi:hypothetical protein